MPEAYLDADEENDYVTGSDDEKKRIKMNLKNPGKRRLYQTISAQKSD